MATSKIIELHIPSILGYEKVAMDSAAAAARIIGFHDSRIEDLRTAISEACTNAIKHGNRLNKDTKVLVTLTMADEKLEVEVRDRGKGIRRPRQKDPRIENQLAESQQRCGWGIFLIEQLVDELEFQPVPEGGYLTRMVIHVDR